MRRLLVVAVLVWLAISAEAGKHHKDGKHKDKKHHGEDGKQMRRAFIDDMTRQHLQCRACVATTTTSVPSKGVTVTETMKWCSTGTSDYDGTCVSASTECAMNSIPVTTAANCPSDLPATKKTCSLCTLDGYAWCQDPSRPYDELAGSCVSIDELNPAPLPPTKPPVDDKNGDTNNGEGKTQPVTPLPPVHPTPGKPIKPHLTKPKLFRQAAFLKLPAVAFGLNDDSANTPADGTVTTDPTTGQPDSKTEPSPDPVPAPAPTPVPAPEPKPEQPVENDDDDDDDDDDEEKGKDDDDDDDDDDEHDEKPAPAPKPGLPDKGIAPVRPGVCPAPLLGQTGEAPIRTLEGCFEARHKWWKSQKGYGYAHTMPKHENYKGHFAIGAVIPFVILSICLIAACKRHRRRQRERLAQLQAAASSVPSAPPAPAPVAAVAVPVSAPSTTYSPGQTVVQMTPLPVAVPASVPVQYPTTAPAPVLRYEPLYPTVSRNGYAPVAQAD